MAPQRQKKTNFPPNDKKMTNKMTILQVAKSAFFSKHCHFLVIFSHVSSTFPYFSIFLRKWHQNDKK
jgi:hypothetical protein